jgi:hypothetical protein
LLKEALLEAALVWALQVLLVAWEAAAPETGNGFVAVEKRMSVFHPLATPLHFLALLLLMLV